MAPPYRWLEFKQAEALHMTLHEFRRMPVADVLPLLDLLEAEAGFRTWQAAPLQTPGGDDGENDGGLDGE